MKVFFDIITNHTADVIGYEEGARRPYVSKDVEPYRTASGNPFDDRDYAGTGSFPPLDADRRASPTRRCSTPPSRDLKVPAWLNDVTLYHNRGDTTFVGENSLLRRLLRARRPLHRAPARGRRDDRHLQDVDPGLGHRRLPDRHDEARQRRVLAGVRARGARRTRAARASASSSCSARCSTPRSRSRRTSRRTTTCRRCIDFPFQAAAENFAAQLDRTRATCATSSPTTTGTPTPTRTSTSCRRSSGTTTWAASASSSRGANPGATDAELVARDRLAHELMYLSRGNPVIYYGDEQGFTGDRRRPGRAPGHVRAAVDARLPRRRPASAPTATHAAGELRPGAPALSRRSATWRGSRSATTRCATARSSTATRRRRPASTRSRGSTAAPARVRRGAQQLRERADRARCRPTCRAAGSTASTAPAPAR